MGDVDKMSSLLIEVLNEQLTSRGTETTEMAGFHYHTKQMHKMSF